MAHASDSAVQREAELVILAALSEKLGVPLAKRRIDLPAGAWAEVDGAAPDLSVLAEAFARQGAMQGGQRRKLALDVLKLITIRRQHPDARLILAFCDQAAIASLVGWQAEAVHAWQVDTVVVDIPDELRARLVQVQAEQYR